MIIDGRAAATEIEAELRQTLLQIGKKPPALAFIRVGENPASIAYIRQKKKKCLEVGIESVDHELPEQTSEACLLHLIETLNRDADVNGILVQLPLPPHINTRQVIEAIAPSKDVDGFHPLNMGKLLSGDSSGFFSCTPYGIVKLLEKSKIDPGGKHVVIVGRSNIVGKPLAALLVQKRQGANATVTIAHSHSDNLPHLTRSADILVAAVGNPQFIGKEMIKPGAVVIDVGISRLKGKLVGDVDFDNVKEVASRITPVPGGVGPMTIAMLLSNTLTAYTRQLQ